MATKKGCRRAGKAVPKTKGGSCGAKLKSGRKSKKSTGGCRDAKGDFVPIPACTGKRRRRR